MSTIDTQTVRKIAKLARIRVSDDEANRFSAELSSIFQWIEVLGTVNTDGVEPMAGVGAYTLRQRADVINDGDCAAAVLKNAPEQRFECFVVPKVVE